jgi:hypothetical protein
MEDPTEPEQPLTGIVSRLDAKNSQIGNAAQITSSPGAVVNQVLAAQDPAISGIGAGIFGVLLLLLPAVLSMAGRKLPMALAAPYVGVSSALIVGGFFAWVEGLLKNETKLELAVWLLGVKVGQKFEPWPETFAKVFDRVFGTKHLSWRCFATSAVASYLAMLLVWSCYALTHWRDVQHSGSDFVNVAILGLALNVVPDYFSLLKSRKLLHFLIPGAEGLIVLDRRDKCGLWQTLAVLLTDLGITLAIGLTITVFAGEVLLWWKEIVSNKSFTEILRTIGHTLWFALRHFASMAKSDLSDGLGVIWLYPAFFTSIWLWLYAGSGFLLKAARRFDIGFQWFNRKFDIEKKPLSAIGLVAGAMFAFVYWGVQVGAWLLSR